VTGLFERALGDEWDELHPQIRDWYGLVAAKDREAVGTGEMHRLSRHPLALPVLWLGTVEDFLFPEGEGTDVPFSITSEAFADGNGYSAFPTTGTLISIGEMVASHGSLNAVRFALPAFLAFRLLDKQ